MFYIYNAELHDLRRIVCLRKSEVSVEKLQFEMLVKYLPSMALFAMLLKL